MHLALQYDLHVTNYPLAEEDLKVNTLPKPICPYADKRSTCCSPPAA